jgi:hypothetical protein
MENTLIEDKGRQPSKPTEKKQTTRLKDFKKQRHRRKKQTNSQIERHTYNRRHTDMKEEKVRQILDSQKDQHSDSKAAD